MIILFDQNWVLMPEIMANPMPLDHVIPSLGLSGVTKSFIHATFIMVFGILIWTGFFVGFCAAGIALL